MDIEVRSLDIEWNENLQVIRVTKNPYPIQVFEENGGFYVETITYPKIFYYFGFRVLKDDILHTPFFTLGDKKEELLKVEDPSNGEVWWIQKGFWDKKRNKFIAESFRTAGILNLNIQHKEILVNNHTNNFSVDELEFFLTDFKNDLWEIILSESSMVGAKVEKKVPNIFSEEVMQLIDKFIDAGSKVLKEPKFFLKEQQGKVPRSKVKPVPLTFRELTTNPNTRILSSRIHKTSFDNSENRYIHFCIDRLFVLLGKVSDVASNLSNKFKERAKQYKEESENLSKSEFKKISKELFDVELEELKEQYNKIRGSFTHTIAQHYERSERSAAIDSTKSLFNKELQNLRGGFKNFFIDSDSTASLGVEIWKYDFSLDSMYSSGKYCSFFCNYLNGRDFKNDPEFKRKYLGRYLVVEYPQIIFDFLNSFSNKGYSVRVIGSADWGMHDRYCKFTWRVIQDIQLIDSVGVIQKSTYEFSLDKSYGSSKSFSFFCNIINGERFKDYKEINKQYYGEYLVVTYPEEIFNELYKHAGKKYIIRVTGIAKQSSRNNNGKDFCQIIWDKIENIQLLDTPLNKEITNREQRRNNYVSKNWTVEYTQQEKQEILQEARSLASREELLLNTSTRYLNANQQATSRHKKLRDLKQAFKRMKIGKSSNFPNSMVFVQNPNYSAVHINFRAVMDRANINLSQLESIIAIEHIGLIAISGLYERWVLLQIIKILTDEFHLFMEEGWQDNLITSILSSQHSIEFKTSMPNHQFDIVLSYEKVLPNKKRPDFVLDIHYKKYRLLNENWVISDDGCSRLVMDAKFYDDSTEDKINKTLDELVEKKDYSEGNENRVFIIHPSPELIKINKITSPLSWNRSCDYGHVAPSMHKFGHIFLAPSLKYKRSIDNLKRLLILHFQEVIDILPFKITNNKDSPSWHNFFCPNCAAGNDSLDIKCFKTKGGENSWSIQCKSCKGHVKETFCYACKHRLFKNGFQWTYHRTYAEKITNCKCPSCEADLSFFNLS